MSEQRPVNRKHGPIKLACMQFAAGGSAGLVEICLMHPLDVVKTRFQVQTTQTGAYTSLLSCFRSMYRNEGFLSFYKGIIPPILAETPKRATKFLTFEQYKTAIISLGDIPLPIVFSMAGFLSGCTEAFVVNPFEVVKVKQQSEKCVYTKIHIGSPEMALHIIYKQESAFTTARKIYQANGFGLDGLNKGLTATVCRHGIFNLCYFGIYHSVKGYVTRTGETASVPLRLLIGFTAGTTASIVNIPWDVAKSRIQGPQPVPGQIKYKSTVQTLFLVAREEGVRTLYRGLLPKIMRLGPGGAIMLLVYEHVFDLLKNTL